MHFEGADVPSEGPYATSMPLMHAMNPSNDVMLVFGQNGRVLHPDHGYVCTRGFFLRMTPKVYCAATADHYTRMGRRSTGEVAEEGREHYERSQKAH